MWAQSRAVAWGKGSDVMSNMQSVIQQRKGRIKARRITVPSPGEV